MKICWDSIEKANLSDRSNFKIGMDVYIERVS